MSNFDLEAMGLPIPGLQFPFAGLAITKAPSYETIIGTHGVIFKLSRQVVYKAPIYHNMAPHTMARFDEAKASRKAQSRETRAYGFLKHHPHPHILQSIITVPEGLFLERAWKSVWERIVKHPDYPITWEDKLCWAKEIASAAAWVEKLGFVHGEIRPSNVLLTEQHHVKLAGFDNSKKINRPIAKIKVPCWIDREDMMLAGAATEQFAYASTLYFLENGHDAVFKLTDLGAFISFPHFAPNAFPFAGLIRKAWTGGFLHMAELERAVGSEVLKRRVLRLDVCGLARTVHGAIEAYVDPDKGIMPAEMVGEEAGWCSEWMEEHKKDQEDEELERLRRKVSAQEMMATF
jgi:hypothetical protein